MEEGLTPPPYALPLRGQHVAWRSRNCSVKGGKMGKSCPWAEELAWGPQCMVFRRESDLPLGGRSRSTLGRRLVCVEVSAADVFLEFSPLPSRSWSTCLLTPRVPHAPCAPATAGKKARFGAELGFDRGMYAQINA